MKMKIIQVVQIIICVLVSKETVKSSSTNILYTALYSKEPKISATIVVFLICSSINFKIKHLTRYERNILLEGGGGGLRENIKINTLIFPEGWQINAHVRQD